MLTDATAKLAQADITAIVHSVNPYDQHQDLHRFQLEPTVPVSWFPIGIFNWTPRVELRSVEAVHQLSQTAITTVLLVVDSLNTREQSSIACLHQRQHRRQHQRDEPRNLL